MARVFIDSFESGSLDLWDSLVGPPEVVSTTGLDMQGSYCFLAQPYEYAYKAIPAAAEYWFALMARYTGTGCLMVTLYNTGERMCRVEISSNKIVVRRGYDNVATGTKTLSPDTTYLIEGYYKAHDTTGAIQVKVDGTLDVDFSGDTKPGSGTTVNRFRLDSECYIDNVVIDDAEFPGKTFIAMLTPSGAGNSTQLTPSSGTNYGCVDEIPASDTDYVSTNVINQTDTYQTTNLPSSVCTVKCMQVQSRMNKDGTPTPQNVNMAVRVNGTDYFSSDIAVPSSYASVSNIWTVNPDDSAAWEKADIDGAEIGIKSKT